MIRNIAVSLLILICVSGCSSYDRGKPSVEDIFSQAGDLCQSGNYDKAIALYEKLSSGGVESGTLYYNLGNAYLKKNEVGRAILNYTRARKYIPRDGGLIANDRHARTMMKQADVKARMSLPVQEVLRFFGIFSLNEALGIFFVIYYLLAALIVCAAVIRKARVLIIALAIIVSVFLVIAAIPVIDKIYFTWRGAITVSSVIDAKKEPYEEAPTSFPIYGGMKVYVLKESLGWVKIQRPDGRIGWVPAKGVESVW